MRRGRRRGRGQRGGRCLDPQVSFGKVQNVRPVRLECDGRGGMGYGIRSTISTSKVLDTSQAQSQGRVFSSVKNIFLLPNP